MPEKPPPRSRSSVIPIERWPDADHAAWVAAHRRGNVLDPGGVASSWSAATRHKTAAGYGRYLGWLAERGDLDLTQAPAKRVTPKRLTTYLADLRRLNRGHTIQNRIQELGDALRALAPEGDWRWILRAAARLRASTVPARDKRPRLRPVQDVVAAGFRLMQDAEQNQGRSSLGRAALYRDGLILALLASHPLRLRNFASLRIGHNLMEQGERFMLRIPATETKGHQAYEATLSEGLSQAVRRYLRQYRPVLLASRGRWRAPAGDAFWISKDGSPCKEVTFRNVFRRRIRGPNGKALTPHLLRSCAATTIAVEAPQSVEIIPAVLGHRSATTGERYYNLASGLEASRAHNKMIAEILRGAGRGLPADRRGASQSRGLRTDR